MSNKPVAALKNASVHIVWADILRFIAIIMVIGVHVTDNVPIAERSSHQYVVWGTLLGAFYRPSIPLFVMVTGLLLLPVKEQLSTFWRKRIFRVLIPFVIWSVLYNLFPLLTRCLGFDGSAVQHFFVYAGNHPDRTTGGALKMIAHIPFNFTVYTTHLWYVYMLVGLYLYMPLLSAWITKLTKKQLQLVLVLWSITLFVPYLHEYVSSDLFGTCSWNSFSVFYYFAGFSGYLLLGYYLKNHTQPLSWSKTCLVSIPLFVIGYLVTYVGFKHYVSIPTSTENQQELYFTYCSFNVALMAVAIFMIVKKITVVGALWQKLFASMSVCCYGIYLAHYILLGPIVDLYRSLPLPFPLRIAVTCFTVLVVIWLIVALIRKWKYVKYVIG